ncbi:MAG: PorV/PorQ family protein [Candidatus Eiseniibacteriota bacterium]
MRRCLRAAIGPLLAVLAAAPAAGAPSGFAFLEVPAGARASALAGAFATVGEGVEASFWNPAGLAAVSGLEVTGAHVESFQSFRHDQFAIAGRWLGGGVAASLRAFYSQPIVARDELGNETGTFGGHDLGFGLAYGRALGAGFRVGGSARLIRERIADLSAGTYGLGAGATWQAPAGPALKLGLMVDNVGPDANFTFADGPGQPVPLPMAVQAGAACRWTLPGAARLGASLEARVARGRAGVAMLGGELSHANGAALRLGLRVNDDVSRLSAGAGYAMTSLRLDYAFVPDRLDIGDSHRVSFTASF